MARRDSDGMVIMSAARKALIPTLAACALLVAALRFVAHSLDARLGYGVPSHVPWLAFIPAVVMVLGWVALVRYLRRRDRAN